MVFCCCFLFSARSHMVLAIVRLTRQTFIDCVGSVTKPAIPIARAYRVPLLLHHHQQHHHHRLHHFCLLFNAILAVFICVCVRVSFFGLFLNSAPFTIPLGTWTYDNHNTWITKKCGKKQENQITFTRMTVLCVLCILYVFRSFRLSFIIISPATISYTSHCMCGIWYVQQVPLSNLFSFCCSFTLPSLHPSYFSPPLPPASRFFPSTLHLLLSHNWAYEKKKVNHTTHACTHIEFFSLHCYRIYFSYTRQERRKEKKSNARERCLNNCLVEIMCVHICLSNTIVLLVGLHLLEHHRVCVCQVVKTNKNSFDSGQPLSSTFVVRRVQYQYTEQYVSDMYVSMYAAQLK